MRRETDPTLLLAKLRHDELVAAAGQARLARELSGDRPGWRPTMWRETDQARRNWRARRAVGAA